jgi:hypothetical protein
MRILGFVSKMEDAKVQTIHEIREPVGMWCAVKLSDIHDIILVLQNCSFVVVDVQVIRSRENSHNSRKLRRSSLTIHAITSCQR